MDHGKRIDLINAFRSLEGQPLRVKTQDEEIKRQMQAQFDEWVKNRILDLLNAGEKDKVAEKQPSVHPALAKLSPQQVEALIEVANQIISKRRGKTSIVVPAEAGQSRPAAPADSAENMDKFNKAVLKQIADLDQMDRAGPEY